MKLLITGARGQLGRELTPLAMKQWPGAVIATDIDTLDITDSDAIAALTDSEEITHIVNCAAYTNVERAENEPDAAAAINVDAVANLTRVASSRGVKIIHISTDYVFDGHAFRPYNESDSVNPRQVYGTTKRRGETILLATCPDAIIIRTAWLYSQWGHNFVKTMLGLGRERQEIGVVSDQIGTPTSASDLATAIMTILGSRRWMPGVYHFTDEGVASWFDLAVAVQRIAATGCHVKPLMTADYPTQAERPAYSVLDKTLIKKTFGIDIPHWEVSLEKCVEQLLQNTTDGNKPY